MKEETNAIYGKPRFGLIVIGFGATILVVLLLGYLYLRSGHPVMHTQPQPKDNKGSLALPPALVRTA